jgi:hypothetical protein
VLDYVFLLNEKAKKVSEYSKLYTKEDGHILHTGIVSHTFLFLFFCLLKGNQEENSQVQQKQVKGREGQDRRSSSRNKKGDKENYTSCSNHNSISGKYFFLALQRSCLKLNLKISRPRRLLAVIPLKIVSFLTDQMLQHMMMIISIKNLLAIYLLKLSNLCSGSGELITVSPIRPQHSLARLHSRNR